MKINKVLIGSVSGLGMLGSVVGIAMAASVAANGSFETGTAPGVFTTLVTGSTAIDNWTVEAGNIDYIGSYWQASEGDRSIDMTGSVAGSISQEVPTTAGAVYNVTFDMSGNPAGGPALKEMNVDAGGAETLFTYDTSVAGTTLADMKWEEKSFQFTATGATTTLTFTSLNAGFFGPALDNVVVEQDLPDNKDECKKGGWQTFGIFKNQGDCVSYVVTGGRNLPAGQ